jgi:hypothetical protein
MTDSERRERLIEILKHLRYYSRVSPDVPHNREDVCAAIESLFLSEGEDRERLDWLEANACEVRACGDNEGGYWSVINNQGYAFVSPAGENNVRAAIDAASAAQPEGGKP